MGTRLPPPRRARPAAPALLVVVAAAVATAAAAAAVAAVAPPVIRTQPAAVVAARVGGTVTLTVGVAPPAPTSIQWQRRRSSVPFWFDVPGRRLHHHRRLLC